MPDSARDPLTTSPREMAELARAECLELLSQTHFGRLAVAIGDGPPAIRPINYTFDERSQSVVFRTMPGSKLYGLLRSMEAAFEIDGIDEQTRTGWSVIIQGVAEVITDNNELARLAGDAHESWIPVVPSHWVRIRAFTVSGRRIGLLDRAEPDARSDPEARPAE